MNGHMIFSNEVRSIVPTSNGRVAAVLFYYFKLKVYDVQLVFTYNGLD